MENNPNDPQNLEQQTPERTEEERKARLEYLRSITPPQKQKSKWRKVLWILLIVIVAAALAVGAYLKFFRDDSKPTTQKSPTTSTPQNQQQATKTATKHYESTTFSLSLDYPEDWTVADSDNSKFTITSPATQLTDEAGQATTGQIVLTVQQKGTVPPAFEKGSAIAVRESQKIAYTKPSSTQRANTYLSFLQYAATAAHGTLDGAYITGDFGYQKDQYVPKTDIVKLDPLISLTFQKCDTDKCASPAALSISGDSWSNESFSGPLVKMLKSIQVQ